MERTNLAEYDIRVYVLDCNYHNDFDFRGAEMQGDLEGIIAEAERRGTVYSLEGFQEAANNDEVSLINSFILIN